MTFWLILACLGSGAVGIFLGVLLMSIMIVARDRSGVRDDIDSEEIL